MCNQIIEEHLVLDFLDLASLEVLALEEIGFAHLARRRVDTSADLGEGVEFLRLEEVQVDGEAVSDNEAGERNAHGDARVLGVGNGTEHDREDSTARDGSDNERSTALGVATETTKGQSKDSRKDARLEE